MIHLLKPIGLSPRIRDSKKQNTSSNVTYLAAIHFIIFLVSKTTKIERQELAMVQRQILTLANTHIMRHPPLTNITFLHLCKSTKPIRRAFLHYIQEKYLLKYKGNRSNELHRFVARKNTWAR